MTTDRQLDQAVNHLPREILPPKDLWAGIDERLEVRQSQHWLNQPAQRWAAIFALAAAGMLWWSQNPDITVAPELAMLELEPEQQIIASYEQAKAQQLGQIGVVSEDAGDWRYQLTVWDQAIVQVQTALSYHPHEPFLLAQMHGLYQQQLEYLQLISALTVNDEIWTENRL